MNGLGVVSYNKVGGITAAQINEEVSGIYEVFNGGEAAQPFGPSLGATNGVKFFRLNLNTIQQYPKTIGLTEYLDYLLFPT